MSEAVGLRVKAYTWFKPPHANQNKYSAEKERDNFTITSPPLQSVHVPEQMPSYDNFTNKSVITMLISMMSRESIHSTSKSMVYAQNRSV